MKLNITFRLLIVYFILLLSSQNVSYAQDFAQNLPEISDKLDSKIDLTLTFIDETGQTKTIKDMFKGQSVLILTLNYFRCTTMCTYQFLNMATLVKEATIPLGKGYNIASISFDPTDTVQKAKQMHDIWVPKTGNPQADWNFFVGKDMH